MTIHRPKTIKVFANQASQGDYLPTKFGTNTTVMKKGYAEIANDNFEFGLESLEKDLQLKDLNSVFFYHGNLLAYLFQQGVPEFSAYQDYPMGAIVQHKGNLWIATKDQKAQKKELKIDQCNPCGCEIKQEDKCSEITEPSKESGWCSFVTHCEYDVKMEELDETIQSLQESINSIKSVESFNILPNISTGVLELTLTLTNGNQLIIPMVKFGHISKNDITGEISIFNADGSTLVLPKYVAEESLDQQKGFYFNKESNKWEIDLTDLIKDGSGLEVDKNGYISVKPSELVDNESLSVDSKTGKIKVKPEFVETISDKTVLKTIEKLDERGAKVYVNGPITGDGTTNNHLGLNFNTDDFEVLADGSLTLKVKPPVTFTTFDSNYKFGFHTFTGSSKYNGSIFVRGVPLDINAEVLEQDRALTADQQVDSGYDFNGYYIASAVQLDVWLSGVDGTVWKITNDSGVNDDGTVKDSLAWGKWQKLDNNNNITNEMIKRLQDQVNSLSQKNQAQDIEIEALKQKNQAQDEEIQNLKNKHQPQDNNVSESGKENCPLISIFNGQGGNLKLSENEAPTWILDGVQDYTITLDNGRTPSIFNIIRGKTANTVRFVTGAGATLILPPNKIAELDNPVNSVVTIVGDGNNTFRIVGGLKGE